MLPLTPHPYKTADAGIEPTSSASGTFMLPLHQSAIKRLFLEFHLTTACRYAKPISVNSLSKSHSGDTGFVAPFFSRAGGVRTHTCRSQSPVPYRFGYGPVYKRHYQQTTGFEPVFQNPQFCILSIRLNPLIFLFAVCLFINFLNIL